MSSASEITLDAIGKKYASDKFTVHGFTKVYESHLAAVRHKALKLLEIGIGGEGRELGGNSLLTWREYLPNSTIVGIDIFEKNYDFGERIYTEVCDQSDRAALSQVVDKYGPFDIIIDDGSHKGSDVAVSFTHLFPSMQDGGQYFIEDVQTSYWPNYGGSSLATYCQDGGIRWARLAIDVINRSESLDPDIFPWNSGLMISELHAYHNIVAFVKGQTAKSSVLNCELTNILAEQDRLYYSKLKEVHQKMLHDPGFLRKVLLLAETALSLGDDGQTEDC